MPLRERFAHVPSDVMMDLVREAWLLYAVDPTPEALDRVLYLLDWDAVVHDPDYVSPPTIGRRPPLYRVLDGIVDITFDDVLDESEPAARAQGTAQS